MKLLKVCEKLDQELCKESLTVHEDESKYAVPPKTICTEYDEIFREYKIFGGRIFTVMIRETKSDNKYWVRCGYKENADSKYVGGIQGRDCETYSVLSIIKHCINQFDAILKYNGW